MSKKKSSLDYILSWDLDKKYKKRFIDKFEKEKQKNFYSNYVFGNYSLSFNPNFIVWTNNSETPVMLKTGEDAYSSLKSAFECAEIEAFSYNSKKLTKDLRRFIYPPR